MKDMSPPSSSSPAPPWMFKVRPNKLRKPGVASFIAGTALRFLANGPTYRLAWVVINYFHL